MESNNNPPLIMGILNVTPDSFSDGGQYNMLNQALAHVQVMLEQGADIIDIGGESTRPGADSISTKEQILRVVPVIEGIRHNFSEKITISVDTTDYQVASAALAAGANWINDVSAGEDARNEKTGREEMLELAAEKGVSIVLMHRKGKSSTMQDAPHYENILLEVSTYLKERASLALDLGVKKENIIIDPGIGFGKLLEHNLTLLANLKSLVKLGFPVLLGTSRKRFIGEICVAHNPKHRVAGTCATTALAVNQGVQILRVHDVFENRQAADIAWEIRNVTANNNLPE